jgi:hypothetical protein
MRKLTGGPFSSLDGIVEAPDEWHFPYFNDELGAAVGAQLGSSARQRARQKQSPSGHS